MKCLARSVQLNCNCCDMVILECDDESGRPHSIHTEAREEYEGKFRVKYRVSWQEIGREEYK